MPENARANRTMGMVMIAGAVMLAILAILFAVGVLPGEPASRSWIAIALGLAAMVDFGIGLRYLLKP